MVAITVELSPAAAERLANLADVDAAAESLEARAARALAAIAEAGRPGVCRDWIAAFFEELPGLRSAGPLGSVIARAEQYADGRVPIERPRARLRPVLAEAYVDGFRSGRVEATGVIPPRLPHELVGAAGARFAHKRAALVDVRRELDQRAALVDGWLHGFLDATRDQRRAPRAGEVTP